MKTYAMSLDLFESPETLNEYNVFHKIVLPDV